MFRFFYRLIIGMVVKSLPLIAVFSKKVKIFLASRKKESELFKDFKRPQAKVYWYHCASLGEYEQAKPLIKKLAERDDAFTLVSFFSPSGYEIIKPKQTEDCYISYLPLEQKRELKAFIKKVQPTKVFWIKYELWLQALSQIIKLNVPTYLVSASFKPNHLITKNWGKPWRGLLAKFTQVFVQNEKAQEVLKQIGVESKVTGDTRFDNVSEIALQGYENEKLSDWKGKDFLLVAGSSWQEEESLCYGFLEKRKDVKAILAPHDISEKHISEIKKVLEEHQIKYALWNEEYKKDTQVVLLNTIGQLSKVYKYADLAFVGGGFRKGLHNILEPLAWGVPVTTGPNIKNNWEAVEAEKSGLLKIVQSEKEIEAGFQDSNQTLDTTKFEIFMSKYKNAIDKIAVRVFS